MKITLLESINSEKGNKYKNFTIDTYNKMVTKILVLRSQYKSLISKKLEVVKESEVNMQMKIAKLLTILLSKNYVLFGEIIGDIIDSLEQRQLAKNTFEYFKLAVTRNNI